MDVAGMPSSSATGLRSPSSEESRGARRGCNRVFNSRTSPYGQFS